MKVTRKLIGLWAIVLGQANSAPPQIGAIVNAASYALPGQSNSGIAQGSIFVVFGTELGPAELQQASGFPLPTTLGGTSMRVRIDATTVDAFMIYSSATQAAAILPSNTPVGIGLLEVTYRGRASQSGAFRIQRSGPGILTQNQTGNGPALAQNFNSETDQPRNGFTRAAHPGQLITLWGTGLGAITGNDSVAPVPRDLNLNLKVLVGGKLAAVRYKGRSGCCAGVDQITFEMPRGVEGCYVPVAVRVDDMVSNFATIAVAGAGNVCTNLEGISGADLEKLQGGGNISYGSMFLYLGLDCDYYYGCTDPRTAPYLESGSASFFRYGLQQLSFQLRLGLPSPGSCIIYAPSQVPFAVPPPSLPLNAGPVLNVSGPKGARQLTLNSPGNYFQQFSTGATQVQFLEPGNYVVDNGPGGVDVGPFRAALSIPKPFTATVQRSTAGVKVVWSGGDSSSFVTVQGAGVPVLNRVSASFVCTERVAAGQFTIPEEVFLSLPPDSVDHSGVMVSATSAAATLFRAPGLDIGKFSYVSSVP